MISALEVFRLVFAAITGLSGTMINSLVLTFYLLQWKRSSNSVVYDQIQMSIALTNIFHQSCLSVDVILEALEILFNLGKRYFELMFTLDFSLFYASAWNTAWLSIFFCVRLVNFSHPYLLRMKAMFLSCVPQLMVGSVLGSVIISLPFFWLTEVNITQDETMLTNVSSYRITIHFGYTMFSSFFGCFLPLTLTCLCIGQCVTSLLRHVWRIKLSESRLTSSQLQGHIRATRIMIMRVLLDFMFYLLVMVSLLTSFQMGDTLVGLTGITALMYPTAQSLILIHGNPKLKSKICRQRASN